MTRQIASSLAALVLLTLLAALGASYVLACPGEPPVNEEEKKCNGAANPFFKPCFTGDPVITQTGVLTESQTDLALRGRGPALAVRRSYDSRAALEAKEAGLWGYGWSGPYGSHLIINKESGAITAVQENGATAGFTVSGGKYVPGGWIQATLVKEEVEAKTIYVFTLPDQEKLKFNSEGQLIEQKDRNSNAITLTYEAGKLKTVKDAAGRELKFTYNVGGQVESVEDPMGHKVKYVYESGNLASVTLPGETEPRWKFKYGTSHELTEMTDGRGGVTKNEYDEKHRVKKQTDPMERTTKFEYGETEGHKTTTVTEPNGSTTFYKFNEAGEPLEEIRAKGTAIAQATTTEYNGAYEPIKVTDALGHSTTYEYDAEGNRTLEKDAEGDETKWTYDTSHDVTSETTPKGEKTTYKFDAHGNLEAVERPAPGATTQKMTFKHAANGDLEAETEPLGHETKFEYDTYGDVKAKTDAEGDKTTWVYNTDGYQTSEVSPRGNEEGAKASEFETTTELDAQNRPIKGTDPLGHETKYGYDKNGNVESVTDALGHKAKYTYDADNEKTKVEAANGTTSETGYDSEGQVKSKTDGNSKTTKYEHNALEELTETIDPLEHKTTREYDKAGNLEKLKDSEGRTTTFTYDKANRLTKKSYSEVATHAVEYTYNKDGDVTKMVDGTGTTENTYDILDRLSESKNGNGEVVKYEYNLDNLPTKITYPNGKSVTREYDNVDRLSKVTDWLSHSTTFTYNRDSELKGTTLPTEATDEDVSEFNRADQLVKQTFKKGAETLASLAYSRDKVGNVESTTQAGLPGSSPSYEYDQSNRLAKGAGTTFEYDNAGNPKKIGATELKYDVASELEKAGTTNYGFDKLGERTKSAPEGGSETKYGWDQAGNLTTVKRATPAIEDSYTYDGNGLRESETISGTTKHLAWDTAESLPLILYDGTSYYVYGPEGLPIEQISSETPTWLHHDQQGSTRLLTSQAGTVSGAYSFTPYGTTEGHTGTATSNLLYDGQYTSPDTGLIYLRARVYDPSTAQFMSVDPLVAETGESYGFSGQNPVNRGDPTGDGWTGPCLQQTCPGGGGWQGPCVHQTCPGGGGWPGPGPCPQQACPVLPPVFPSPIMIPPPIIVVPPPPVIVIPPPIIVLPPPPPVIVIPPPIIILPPPPVPVPIPVLPPVYPYPPGPCP
ncbi:MAG TPA: RHS repeat-associated core domain-containing protein [Solirubrobacterales bacterium]|nr:RHS repeat-associated core domain-containing protein [Solirubrobacterales bacterium]